VGKSPTTDLTSRIEEKVKEAINMSLWRKEYMTYREHMEEQYNEGREVGYEAGIEDGINGTVNILRSMNVDDNTIVIKLCEQYKLTESEAKEYILS
jgi:flagellar biosynthesis/type III secretory pathway protein FliH